MITHVGSINVDYIVHNKRLPMPGETVFGDSLSMAIGGKGAIQIGAVARLGVPTCFISMMGELDPNLPLLKSDLAWAGVNCERIGMAKDMLCGSAFVMVEESGANAISIVHAADRAVTPEYVEQNRDVIRDAKVVMTEFMPPMETCEYAMKMAKEYGAVTIVNPAPVKEIPDGFYQYIDIITPNESEAAGYCGFAVDDEKSAAEACAFFHGKGVKNVVITLGGRGAFVSDGQRTEMVEAYKVKAVDTTGAGDSFNAGLAVAIWKDKDLFTAAKFANAVSSVSVQRKGSFRSIPTYEEVAQVFAL
ncbi:ribokinase [Christensenella timonensis]|uniref:ribokinase n=1 Tax=Christensenella timonensis TaxID=1816678 RepID=UPI0008333F74|nr:ribokinase [Christensenella timonensis]